LVGPAHGGGDHPQALAAQLVDLALPVLAVQRRGLDQAGALPRAAVQQAVRGALDVHDVADPFYAVEGALFLVSEEKSNDRRPAVGAPDSTQFPSCWATVVSLVRAATSASSRRSSCPTVPTETPSCWISPSGA